MSQDQRSKRKHGNSWQVDVSLMNQNFILEPDLKCFAHFRKCFDLFTLLILISNKTSPNDTAAEAVYLVLVVARGELDLE